MSICVPVSSVIRRIVAPPADGFADRVRMHAHRQQAGRDDSFHFQSAPADHLGFAEG
jgi:hypothetical protein